MTQVKANFFLLICCSLLIFFTFPDNPSLVLGEPPTFPSGLPSVFHTKINREFEDNQSVFFSISGGTVTEWNTSSSIPFEYFYSIQHETLWTNDYFSIVFYVDFFDSSGDFQIQLNKTIFTGGNYGLQWIDGGAGGQWDLPANLTHIPNGHTWTGEAYWTASIRVGPYHESNSTKKLSITYRNLTTTSQSIHLFTGFSLLSILIILTILGRTPR